MVMPFMIGAARVVIPGVYDTLRVQSSLPGPVPAGRSILILGESEEGIPGKLLDLRLNYFTDFNSVRDFYKTGTIVDAARMAFTAQPGPVFGGAINRLYVWKTNQTTRASKSIASPVGYGSMVASKYGEDGNMIKSQIKGLSEVLPTKTFSYLPSPDAQALKVVVNGALSDVNITALNPSTGAGCNPELSAKLNMIDDLACSVPIPKITITSDVEGTISSTVNSDEITIVATAGTFGASVVAGDVAIIPESSTLEGDDAEFVGVYSVVSWAATTVTLKQLKHFDSGSEAPVAPFGAAFAISSATATDLFAFSPLAVSVTAGAPAGAAASLELASESGALVAARNMVDMNSLVDAIRLDDIGVANISAVAASGKLTVTLDSTMSGWSILPKAGYVARISRKSPIAGAAKENVGLYVVESATQKTLVLKTIAEMSPVSVASAPSNVAAEAVEVAPGFVSTALAAQKISSASETRVWVDATDTKNNVVFPSTKVGGIVYLEVGFNDGVEASCTLSIDVSRTMTITTSAQTLTVKINKYKSLQNLADFLNTKTGLYAKVPAALNKTLPTSVLDAVDSVAIMGAFSPLSTNGKIKGDYYAFKKLMDDNFGLLSYAPGVMVLKAGLPDVEATAGYLQGAVIGGSSDADVQAGLDESLKIDVRNVVPCFSRDALEDVADSLTDTSSSYSIDSIHAAVKGHVATASSIKIKRYRFGILSIHESFAEAKDKCAAMAYERLQMTFQQVRAIDGAGSIQWFLPWMSAMAVATGRSQAALGTSMLRKTLAFSDVKHVGKKSLYDDTLIPDFDAEDAGKLEEAITAGLLTFRAVTGFGIRTESPDVTTRSRDNDPEGWVWERASVLFVLDEVRATVNSVLENYIGSRQSDVSTSVIAEAINSTLRPFLSSGALIGYKVLGVVKEGVGYRAKLQCQPTEALEFIGVEIEATRG